MYQLSIKCDCGRDLRLSLRGEGIEMDMKCPSCRVGAFAQNWNVGGFMVKCPWCESRMGALRQEGESVVCSSCGAKVIGANLKPASE
jgi:hypothetical protein